MNRVFVNPKKHNKGQVFTKQKNRRYRVELKGVQVGQGGRIK